MNICSSLWIRRFSGIRFRCLTYFCRFCFLGFIGCCRRFRHCQSGGSFVRRIPALFLTLLACLTHSVRDIFVDNHFVNVGVVIQNECCKLLARIYQTVCVDNTHQFFIEFLESRTNHFRRRKRVLFAHRLAFGIFVDKRTVRLFDVVDALRQTKFFNVRQHFILPQSSHQRKQISRNRLLLPFGRLHVRVENVPEFLIGFHLFFIRRETVRKDQISEQLISRDANFSQAMNRLCLNERGLATGRAPHLQLVGIEVREQIRNADMRCIERFCKGLNHMHERDEFPVFQSFEADRTRLYFKFFHTVKRFGG